ncbi:MAG: acetyl-CoA C-acetyltransferase [Desulfobacterales bacterium]|nr:acetyl-CoA C-acetyltransferase [Desulfobacterales bacterium]
MRDVVIVSGSRTAIGSFGGSLKTVPVTDLGAIVMEDTLKKAGVRPVVDENIKSLGCDKLKDQGQLDIEKKAYEWDDSLTPIAIDEVVMGNVLQTGQGQNTARQAMIKAGIPKETPAFTINKICGSGLKAIAIGAASILSGQADVILAGGQENMSQVPMALPKARWGYNMEITGKGDITDLMVFDGLYEIFYGYHMGVTAENIASLYDISRLEQDELGTLSHARAMKAINGGLFKDEIVPVVMKTRKGEIVFDTDERPMETSVERMGKLRPVFKKDGTVTAGNASGINDAAASVLMMTSEKAKELGLDPILKIKGFSAGGIDPAYMGLGPVPAVKKVLKTSGMSLDDIEMIELNEAFASQAIGCMRELGIDVEKPNEVGSGISLGHPIGCTGARQMVSGMYHMQRNDYSTGLISMCIGGGMGMAMIVER